MPSTKILVVDDDVALCQLLERALAQDGWSVVTAASGKEALHTFFIERPDLVILDVMMPEMDGFEVCRRLRDLADVPIIMLTVLGHEEYVVKGLAAGADDYITKPFHLSVLRARIDAVLRRTSGIHDVLSPVEYADDYLVVNLVQRRVLVDGELVKLSPTEYSLLAILVEHAGQVVTYQQILEHVWGWEYHDQIDYVHVYVSRLRRKIEPDPMEPRYLLTESRVGYRFEAHGHGLPTVLG